MADRWAWGAADLPKAKKVHILPKPLTVWEHWDAKEQLCVACAPWYYSLRWAERKEIHRDYDTVKIQEKEEQ